MMRNSSDFSFPVCWHLANIKPFFKKKNLEKTSLSSILLDLELLNNPCDLYARTNDLVVNLRDVSSYFTAFYLKEHFADGNISPYYCLETYKTTKKQQKMSYNHLFILKKIQDEYREAPYNLLLPNKSAHIIYNKPNLESK
jgi:hypothetical protein